MRKRALVLLAAGAFTAVTFVAPATSAQAASPRVHTYKMWHGGSVIGHLRVKMGAGGRTLTDMMGVSSADGFLVCHDKSTWTLRVQKKQRNGRYKTVLTRRGIGHKDGRLRYFHVGKNVYNIKPGDRILARQFVDTRCSPIDFAKSRTVKLPIPRRS